ncbi:MAG: chemotaxis protein CheA [Burkholderiales bacterium]|nr:chemotaxis protein CheA [Burkholderiales bacterium]
MSDIGDVQELLQDFLTEAGEMLEDVDRKLVELESSPSDRKLLNAIFRGFHTIKSGAGFIGAQEIVDLCHRTENLFDQLRSDRLDLRPAMLDVILAVTAEVKRMMGQMGNGHAPSAAPSDLLQNLDAYASGQAPADIGASPAVREVASGATSGQAPAEVGPTGPDWQLLLDAIAPRDGTLDYTRGGEPGVSESSTAPAPKAAGAPRASVGKENTIRVDTARFDQILNLSGEIGLIKNRLNCLRAGLQGGAEDARRSLEVALTGLDTLVSDLQSAVMKARMQPVGRVFQKYNRLARDVARTLGKEVDLIIEGAQTEVDKTILDELNDALVHLVRNAVDHGLEEPAERAAAGKPGRGAIRLSASQDGDHIVIEISDDGRGMRPEFIRQKAVQMGLISAEEANALDDRACLRLIFLPGFSTKTEISAVSGRGVGMDVVRNNIERLKGRIELSSTPGKGSQVRVYLPLTLAILPVLMMKLAGQTYAMPLNAVREIIALDVEAAQSVAGAPHVVVRGEVLPVVELAELLGRPRSDAVRIGVVASAGERGYVLAVDSFVGQDEVMIKPLEGLRPRGVAGATMSGEGVLVLVLEMRELLEGRL